MSMKPKTNTEWDWRGVEKRFAEILIADNYEQHIAEQLAFGIRQILEDARPLLAFAESDANLTEREAEALVQSLFDFFLNSELFEETRTMLVR